MFRVYNAPDLGFYLDKKCAQSDIHYAHIFTEKERRPVQWASLFILKEILYMAE